MIDIYIYIHSVKKYVGGGGALQIITMSMRELSILLHDLFDYYMKRHPNSLKIVKFV